MRITKSSAMAVLFAIMMVTVPMAATAAPDGSHDRVSPALQDAIGIRGYNLPSDVEVYTTGAHPGVFVSYDQDADRDSLAEWANSSDDRKVVTWYNASDTALIAAPMSHIAPTTVDRFIPGGTTTVSELDYVTGLAFDRQVSVPDTIGNLETEAAWQKPAGASWAEARTSGEYRAKAMAWDDDAPPVTMADVNTLIGADDVSVTGAGVNVAVIDTGVNFGNGTEYGDGTTGSDFRVVDAHDFVDEESVNLSVSRANVTDELQKVEDGNGHGSWVSSAVLNANSGVAPDANLMAYRALNDEGEGSTANIREAIARADREGADIIVMSLGSPIHSDALHNEIRRSLTDGNVTAVYVAAGNSYLTTRYVSSPADTDGVIAVSATNAVNASTAQKAYFANVGPDPGLDGSGVGDHNSRGETPEVAAPGMKISTTVYTESGRKTDKTLSGTSMAAPIAAGVGALTLEKAPGLKGNHDAFRERVIDSGAHTPKIGTTESTGGMVDAERAVTGYDGEDATDRDLNSETDGRDAANRAIAGDVGVRIARLSGFVMGGA